VLDLLAEPAFATPAHAIAAGYDRHYSSEPGATNPLVVAPRSIEELRQRADVVHTIDLALAVTYGSLMTLLTAATRMNGVDPIYKERSRRRNSRTRTPTSASSSDAATAW
jgi:4-hydroxybutyryl-CoA dehydratase/vinylacetyl-CoA-Delta-isomerase